MSSDDLYVTSPKWATVIMRHLTATSITTPIVELNPGIGILTKQLLENTLSTIHCLEGQKVFKTHMETLFLDHVDRMTYSEGNLMKMNIRDSLDNGQRTMKFLGQQKRNWEDGRADIITHSFLLIRLINCCPSRSGH